jgi:hypothetical protein
MSNYSFRAKAEPLGTFATKTASFFSVLMALLTFSLSLAGVAMAQDGNTRLGESALVNNTEGDQNTAIGAGALFSNTTGNNNTASGALALPGNTTGDQNTATGVGALFSNTTGDFNTASGVATLAANTTGSNNTASGVSALFSNTTGNFNTAIGNGANVSAGDLTNATAIGNGATVDASNKIRLESTAVTVIEGQVAFTASSDKTQKEIFKPVDGEEVLERFAALNCRAGTSSATILKSFATMVPWRKTSLRRSATTELDRSARRRRSTLATWLGFL